MPKIIFDFPTQEDMDKFKFTTMMDATEEELASSVDSAEEVDDRMKYEVTITEEE
jgi:hypothetical protein